MLKKKKKRKEKKEKPTTTTKIYPTFWCQGEGVACPSSRYRIRNFINDCRKLENPRCLPK